MPFILKIVLFVLVKVFPDNKEEYLTYSFLSPKGYNREVSHEAVASKFSPQFLEIAAKSHSPQEWLFIFYFCPMKNRKLKNRELDRLSAEDFKIAEKTPIIVILDNVRSLNNIGSVFRTADAFLIEKIYLCGITATPPHKDIQKTALGATETVAWEYHEDALAVVKRLQEEGIRVLSVEQAENATFLSDFRPEVAAKYALVFGNEVKGVQQEVVSSGDGVLEIPQLGSKHSLNIAVSAGVVLWDLFSKITNSHR